MEPFRGWLNVEIMVIAALSLPILASFHSSIDPSSQTICVLSPLFPIYHIIVQPSRR